ncbi:MAG: phosphoribosylformylglycinamidine synthase subunit PurS [Candidatus Limnocylindria bacterium]
MVVRFSAGSEGEANVTATRMGDELLANPVIEEFAIDVTAE